LNLLRQAWCRQVPESTDIPTNALLVCAIYIQSSDSDWTRRPMPICAWYFRSLAPLKAKQYKFGAYLGEYQTNVDSLLFRLGISS
jgi:hypothetical protein